MDDEIGWPSLVDAMLARYPDAAEAERARVETLKFLRVLIHGEGPRPITEPFPFHNHRTLAEVWGLTKERAG